MIPIKKILFESKAPHTPYLKKGENNYTLLLPFMIIVATLIVTTARDLQVFHKRKMVVQEQNERSTEVLKKSALQLQALHRLQKDLEQLAATDPIAGKINDDFFPRKTPTPPQGTASVAGYDHEVTRQ